MRAAARVAARVEQADDATRDPEPTVAKPEAFEGRVRTSDYLARRSRGAPATEAAATPASAPRPSAPTILVQGGSLRTWSFRNPALERVGVVLSSEGRPVEASIELWQGDSNVPCKMTVQLEDGHRHPFSAVLATPNTAIRVRPSFGDNANAKPGAVPSSVAIRNTGQLEFPFAATVLVEDVDRPSEECAAGSSETIQGGALRTYPFDPMVASVEALLTTDGGPLNARIEILQGPNNNRQVIELYTEDGLTRPFFAIFETPGAGHVIRVINSGPMEYPLSAILVPHSIGDFSDVVDGHVDGPDFVGWEGGAPRVGRYG